MVKIYIPTQRNAPCLLLLLLPVHTCTVNVRFFCPFREKSSQKRVNRRTREAAAYICVKAPAHLFSTYSPAAIVGLGGWGFCYFSHDQLLLFFGIIHVLIFFQGCTSALPMDKGMLVAFW